ncbi:MAG: PilN domain-containing protein [Deltaproteobacteria bacterium]|nr:PilN domain-containing protein [Deltaproteobacteria bacterium]
MIYINLLPVRDVQKKEKLRYQIMVGVLSLAVVLLTCGGLYTSVFLKINTEKASITETQNEIKKLKKVIGEVKHFKKLQKELQGKLDVLAKLKESKSGPVHMLDELVRAVPDKLWLTSFQEKDGTIDIKGVGVNEQVVAQFLQKLEMSPYYQNVELSITEQKSSKGLKSQNFKVVCKTESPKRENSTIAKK